MALPASWLFLAPFILTACGPETVAGPSMKISTEEIDFGQVPLDSSVTEALTIRNDGSIPFEILSASLIEGRSSLWTVERLDSGELETDDSANFDISFAPVDNGNELARVQIRTTLDGFESIYVVLTGSGGLSAADEDGDGHSQATGDCNDDNADIYPGAPELCDGKDNDCDGDTPEDEVDEAYDGYRICEEDCDDEDPNVYPGAEEICDGKDSDCDGTTQDDLDEDEDGYSLCLGDCDDHDPTVWPFNPEICDFIDNDCSGEIDDIDEDGDGYSPCAIGGDCDDEDPWAHPVIVDGSAGNDGEGTPELPYNSLDEALGDLDDVCRSVVLIPGEYTVGLNWSGEHVKIQGAGEFPDDTILMPEDGSRIFDITAGGSLELENLMLYNADTSGDGGALRSVGGEIILTRVKAIENRCTGDGGAISVSSGTLIITESSFQYNTADDDGGALAVTSSIFSDVGSEYFSNDGVRGGALLLSSGSNVTMADLIFQGNDASDEGGAMSIIGGSAIVLERIKAWENTAAVLGGGIALSDLDDSSSLLRNLWVQDNVSGSVGGGIGIAGSRAGFVLANSAVLANQSPNSGAGIYASSSQADDLTIWSNVVAWNNGADGLYVEAGSGASVAHNTTYSTTSGINYSVGVDEDDGENTEDYPGFTDFSNDGNPTDDDVTPTADSVLIDAGPLDGDGPPGYTSWSDADGSRNDRGLTGGAGGTWPEE